MLPKFAFMELFSKCEEISRQIYLQSILFIKVFFSRRFVFSRFFFQGICFSTCFFSSMLFFSRHFCQGSFFSRHFCQGYFFQSIFVKVLFSRYFGIWHIFKVFWLLRSRIHKSQIASKEMLLIKILHKFL